MLAGSILDSVEHECSEDRHQSLHHARVSFVNTTSMIIPTYPRKHCKPIIQPESILDPQASINPQRADNCAQDLEERKDCDDLVSTGLNTSSGHLCRTANSD
jgi:hypothetical protein